MVGSEISFTPIVVGSLKSTPTPVGTNAKPETGPLETSANGREGTAVVILLESTREKPGEKLPRGD